ncbi:MAG TPA: helix-turn-helix transcriptional regulator [Spirochaetia bacterium]|nr:helix-turn-helix transcriptional regulator [Spirochaetia bacterium]
MPHVVFLYEIVCYSVGLIGLLLALLTGTVRHSQIDLRYALFMLCFAIILLGDSVRLYLTNLGITKGAVITWVACCGLAGVALMIAALPWFIHSLAGLPFERRLNQLFGLLGILSLLLVVLLSLGLAPWSLMLVLFAALIVSILYSVTAGNIYARRWPRTDVAASEMERWYLTMKTITVLSVAFIPLFIVVDLFPESFRPISKNLPPTFRIYPAFYLFWSIVYIAVTLPSYLPRHAGEAGEWELGRFRLSPREREVALFLLEGYSYQQIAGKLIVSLATVKTHVNRIYDKCGAGNKMELAVMLRSRHQPNSR